MTPPDDADQPPLERPGAPAAAADEPTERPEREEDWDAWDEGDHDLVDEWGRESFPASDPPASP